MAESADICIIGAGSSGVAVAKALTERALRFDCFEIGSDIGGMWRYENDNGLSSAYESLHIDTSRDNLGYSDFPIRRTCQISSHTESSSRIWKPMPIISACALSSPSTPKSRRSSAQPTAAGLSRSALARLDPIAR
jgi:cation diffusion facilitator CzcD-associated flavoprotein CzcO